MTNIFLISDQTALKIKEIMENKENQDVHIHICPIKPYYKYEPNQYNQRGQERENAKGVGGGDSSPRAEKQKKKKESKQKMLGRRKGKKKTVQLFHG